MTGFDHRHFSALLAHMSDAGEQSLSEAYELGRESLAQGVGLLDVLAWYDEMIRALVLAAPEEHRVSAAAAVGDYFREFLSAFEMTFRSYQDTNRELARLNEELAAANAELRAKQAQLVHSAKMASLGELVAGVAHEINNPLAFVGSHLRTARKGLAKVAAEVQPNLSAKSAEHLSRTEARLHEAEGGLGRIRDLVIKLRIFSRLDEGERKEVSVSECVESVLTILRHRYTGRIDVKTRYGEPDSLDCYPSLLNQALMNLVANAIDAIENSGSISISTGADGEAYRIRIADTGGGIPPELSERVFEPFFTTKPVGVGMGLGLSITYSIVQRHGGKLTLAPGLERGTVATIHLPLPAE